MVFWERVQVRVRIVQTGAVGIVWRDGKRFKLMNLAAFCLLLKADICSGFVVS